MLKILLNLGILVLLLSISNISRATVIDLSITSGMPASQEMEYSRLLNQISWYENINTIDLPTPNYNNYNKYNGNGETVVDVDLDFFSGYVVFKWGNKNQFYYVSDEHSVTFYSTVFGHGVSSPPLGLSHYSKWEIEEQIPHGIPEGNTSVILIGLSTIVGVSILKRRKKIL